MLRNCFFVVAKISRNDEMAKENEKKKKPAALEQQASGLYV